MPRIALLLLALLFASACSSDKKDASGTDAQAISDAAASPPDAAIIQDAHVADDAAGALDSTPGEDASQSEDAAGAIDSGERDSGATDAGASIDAGAADAGDPCATNNGGCDVHATCTSSIGAVTCRCLPGFTGDGHTCQDVAGRLNGLRWELGCIAVSADTRVCSTNGLTVTSTTLAGVQSASYLITLHFRGVVEERTYSGGTGNGFFYTGGTTPSRGDPWNIYSLSVSSPAQTYYLNNGASGMYNCVGLDYMAQIAMDQGATITLTADPVDTNLEEIRNIDPMGMPIVVPGVPPDPMTFDGQFIQMDVTDVYRIR